MLTSLQSDGSQPAWTLGSNLRAQLDHHRLIAAPSGGRGLGTLRHYDTATLASLVFPNVLLYFLSVHISLTHLLPRVFLRLDVSVSLFFVDETPKSSSQLSSEVVFSQVPDRVHINGISQ